ncbi:DUF2267 domain-containing protein [Geitlerinema sp. PCC 9228]|jgi:uncharacterized protein (DUF2267 family)|uniref:DUF2267 domain-containing protein n=1 Tax=Geitlerinema sp. PCC 9228 TaxID=111611 RepID=UPI0008F9E13B|nr:DUF2267 domain-containing protein [Geitlerinema sp. PCC 9228]
MSQIPAENAATADVGKPAFLEKVMSQADLPDIFDARDNTVVVFRTMRDLMPKEAIQRIASQLQVKAIASENKALQHTVSELWMDTNPLVRFLSSIRAPLKIDGDTFVFRIQQEGSLPKNIAPETLIEAVFAAMKSELPAASHQEVAQYLPDGIKQLWQRA